MDERMMQLRVGMLVLGGLIIGGIFVVMFGSMPNFVQGSYPVDIWFETAPEVKPGTPVRKSGILIGRVSDIQFASEMPDAALPPGLPEQIFKTGVVVTARIDGNRTIYDNEGASVQRSLMGDSVVQFSALKDQPVTGEPLRHRDIIIQGSSPSDPLAAVTNMQENMGDVIASVKETAKSLTATSDRLRDLLGRVDEVIEKNEISVEDAVKRTRETMTSVRNLADNVNGMIGDPQTQVAFREVIGELPDTLREARSTIAVINQAAASAKKNMDDLGQLTGPLGEGGADRVQDIDQAVMRFSGLVSELEALAAKLNQGDGTAARLINDPELYENVNAIARDVRQTTEELGPVVHDLRVFSDKIARDPGTIGVRGALRKNTPTKYDY